MSLEIRENLQKFFVLGISYKKTSLDIREKFSMSEDKRELLLCRARECGINGAIVISTCNRTEIYGHTSDIDTLIKLFNDSTIGSEKDFNIYSYILKGQEAINHIYRVSSGLDSQILGDFQVVGQVKEAYNMSNKLGMVNTFLNRLFNYVFQASKKIKNETEISKGASSVSHAAVQYIKEQVSNLEDSNFLLYGTGQIGKDTCGNLLKHMDNRSLTLINRTFNRAKTLADKFNIKHNSIEDLKSTIEESDVIIVATGADEPTITIDHLEGVTGCKLFLDLSVPRNISSEVEELDNVLVITVDGLSQYIKKNMQNRESALPLAQEIIDNSIKEFFGWLEIKFLSPAIVALKDNLEQIRVRELDYHRSKLTPEELQKVEHITKNIVNKIASASINHLKDHHKKASSPIETLNMIFKSE